MCRQAHLTQAKKVTFLSYFMSIPGPLWGLPNPFGSPCSNHGNNFFPFFVWGLQASFRCPPKPSGAILGKSFSFFFLFLPFMFFLSVILAPFWFFWGPSSGFPWDPSEEKFLFFFFFLSSPWASASVEADSLFPHHVDILLLSLVMSSYIPPCPPSCPMEGCQGGQDIGHWPLPEPMPHHPIPESLEDGASEYRCPLLLLWSIIFFLFLFSFLWGPYWAPRGPPSSRSAAGCSRNLQVLPPLNAPARGCGGCFTTSAAFIGISVEK
jgi:hypothetical protein